MTFEQADNLCHRIISFLKQSGGHYTDVPDDHLARVILPCLASNQFVIRIDPEGLRYFACYWMVQRDRIEQIQSGEFPPANEVRSGRYMYVSEVASRGLLGDSRQMIRRLRNKEEKNVIGVYWSQPKRNHRLCAWKEK